MRGSWRVVVAVAALVAVVAGCSGGDSSLTAEPTGAPDAATPDAVAGEVAGEEVAVDDPRFAELAAFYEEFLFASDLHRTPDEFEGELTSGLDELASPAVVADHDAWRAANEALGDSFERVELIESLANITSIVVDGEVSTIVDCTLELETWVAGDLAREVGGTGPELSAYVSRVVEVTDEGATLRVTGVEVTHAGTIDAPGYGCVPDGLASQVRVTLETMLAEYGVAQADPRSGVTSPLAAVVADPLEAELAEALAEQVTENVALRSPTEAVLEVLGIDPRGLGQPAVVVSVCVTYPEGFVLVDLGSGAVVREVFPAGTQDELVVAVRLNDVEGPAVYELVSEVLPTSC